MHDKPIAKPVRVVSVTGGKGGIGKSTISVNLAIAFAKTKKKVLLFDADLGLANVDVMLGLKTKKNNCRFSRWKVQLKRNMSRWAAWFKIIPAASGIQKLADLSTAGSVELIRSFSTLENDIDIMIIDLASGISSQVMNFYSCVTGYIGGDL